MTALAAATAACEAVGLPLAVLVAEHGEWEALVRARVTLVRRARRVACVRWASANRCAARALRAAQWALEDADAGWGPDAEHWLGRVRWWLGRA